VSSKHEPICWVSSTPPNSRSDICLRLFISCKKLLRLDGDGLPLIPGRDRSPSNRQFLNQNFLIWNKKLFHLLSKWFQ